MHHSRSVNFIGRLLAVVLVMAGCAACGNAGTSSSADPVSVAQHPATTHTSTTRAGTTTGVTSSQTSQTTTSATTALPGTGKPVVTVGDKNYTEQFVLGQLYVQALRAEGYTVNINQNIGPTAVTIQALDAGSLTMYPEYMDVFNTAVAGYRHGFRTQLDAYVAAQHYAQGHNLVLLPATPFSDTDGIAVTDAYAADNHLRSIGDLRRVATSATVGGPPQFQQGVPGLPLIAEQYGVTPATFKPLAVGDQYAALNDGMVQAADVNTTDGQLASGDYALLRDPRRIFGWGNVVPVVSGKALIAEGPAFAGTIQRVDDALTTAVMRRLNEAVDISQQSPAAVAQQFLETHGLLTPEPF